MKVLVLGGTLFVGRHIVQALSTRGHDVTIFHRGETACPMASGVRELLGDRNGDLAPLQGQAWDVTIDVSTYDPEQVRRSVALRADRYVFISSVNVYRSVEQPGVAEDAPLAADYDPNTTDTVARYGGGKAQSEALVVAAYKDRATILRPGLIAGKWDPTDRFTYWCERTLGGGEFLAPGNPERPIQAVDAEDLARFLVHLLETENAGVFNVVGPETPMTMRDVLTSCISAARALANVNARPVWADDEFLIENEVGQWIEMPLWVPDQPYNGLLSMSNAKALAAGLTFRPLVETIKSILQWTRSLPSDRVRKAGMKSERERELLDRLSSAQVAKA